MSVVQIRSVYVFVLLAWILCGFPYSAYAFSCTITDDAGEVLRLQKPAERIISLAPDITEILFAIHAGDRVIGVMSGSDYPFAASHILQVGSYSGIDLEKIISLHPDLIVTWGKLFPRQLGMLRKLGIPIYTTEPHRLEDIPRTMKNLGCLVGTEQEANLTADHFLQQLTVLRERYQAKKAITVFYQIGSYSLITINKDSWINQVITLCGGRNVFADAKTIAPEMNWEAVMVANPQVIINSELNDDWKKRWSVWPEIAAIKKNLLFTINPDLINRAGPRLVNGAEQMCRDLDEARKG